VWQNTSASGLTSKSFDCNVLSLSASKNRCVSVLDFETDSF